MPVTNSGGAVTNDKMTPGKPEQALASSGFRVGIDILFIRPGVTGGNETYAVSLLQQLGKIDLQNTYD